MSTGLVLTGLPNIYPDIINDMLGKLNIQNIKVYGVFWNVHKDLEQYLKSINIFEEIHLVDPFLDDSFLPDNFWKFEETISERVLSMFLIREKCSQLIDLQKHTNWIVTRPDLNFRNNLLLNSKMISNNSILIPQEGNYRNGYTDTFVFGNSTSINIYLTTLHRLKVILESKERTVLKWNRKGESFVNLKYLLLRLFKGSSFIPFHPESIIKSDLIQNNINIKLISTGGIVLHRKNNQKNILLKQPYSNPELLNIQKIKSNRRELYLQIEKHY